ncbi:MAG TPA: TolC family protein [Bacteroidia bacterium]|jgi:outer membrane protein TolC|nr:TolC family protein [Bacteroidia bacterium]
MRQEQKISYRKKGSNVLYILIALFFFSFRLSAQSDTSFMSLDAILSKMDTSYPLLLQYNEKLRSIDALAQGSKSWMPPTLSIGADRFGYQPMMWGEQSAMNQAAIMITAGQMFPNPKKIDAHSNSIEAQAAPLKYDSAWLRNDLREKARTWYYERYIAEKKLALLKQNELLLDMLISTAESHYSINQTDLSSIYKAKAERVELTNMEAMFNAQISESNIGLNTLMNRDVNTIFSIDTLIIPQHYSDSVPFDSLLRRNDLLEMDAEIVSMKQQQNYMRTSLRPDFGVSVSHMQMLGMPDQFSVMGMMTVPIAPWSSGMYKSEVRAMDFQIRSMQLEKENMQLMAKQMAAEKHAMLGYETQQLNNYDSLILPAYRDNYNAALLAYRNNTGNFFVLLDAWNMLLMKNMEATDQLYKVLLMQTQYEYEIEK